MKLRHTLGLLSILSLSAQAEILSVHCPLGCPSNPESNDLVFTHIYALSNNSTTKFADWVAYEVNPINYGVSPGRNWNSDPLIDESKTLEPSDYTGANASDLEADRGHQAPLASFAGSRYWYEANYLSNITPQDEDLNQGPWKILEDKVRDIATYEDPLYVITGPLFNSEMSKLPKADEEHVVPSGYFKIVYNNKGAVGFVMPQSSGRNDDFCSKTSTLGNIQTLAGFSLPSLKDNPELKAELGCRN
ncbi:DNA/RNA non-specific endonuclease [Vibrio fluvialis]|uniref:DNA/RNA non-specific endonuclease n=1 Tax=Vibrio fluvialis TaxID=676 RepID=UPI00285A7837|nr:DNA/RNA non-specific endonuclease [Vibrio fluvialis]ELE2163678.1 DNA/RNA non-specific endonuclease [Vibrio fluvialis]ELP2650050.1 DNA/RNA non-specific endonuclease [Vibrio fluvialis]MDZ5513812.1 DNA/RNA non-specific endonuclease [Vibrio fluvialis]